MRRLEIVPMNVVGEGVRNVEVTCDEGAVDHEFRLVICDLARAPDFNLLPERIEIPLDAIDADCQRIDN